MCRALLQKDRWRSGSLAPGSLVSNLDFVESIFGNAGNPFLPENDAGLDPENWTGHTGCVILAPHLIKVKKKEVGCPQGAFPTPGKRRAGLRGKPKEEPLTTGA